MAFRKQNIRPVYKKNSEYEPGDVVIDGGVYERITEDSYGKSSYIFRLDDESLKAVNHCGHIQYLLEEYASFGDYCRITYKGKIKLAADKVKKGQNDTPHTFDLEIDPDRFDQTFAKHRDPSKTKLPVIDSEPPINPQETQTTIKEETDDINGVEL